MNSRSFARPSVLTAFVVAAGLVVVAPAPHAAPAMPPPAIGAASGLPDRLTDKEFWQLETDISEPGGYFRIVDNFTSNEPEIGRICAELIDSKIAGDVYMGVGPEQNLTYIATIRPAMAFIVDIRRQAVMQHLMYKAVFEMAADRADFISVLFARRRPNGLTPTTPIADIWTAYESVGVDPAFAEATHKRIVDRLVQTHGFTLNEDELAQLDSVIAAFQTYGPAITTSPSGRGRGNMSFASLTQADDAKGEIHTFLGNDDNYQFVRKLEETNRLLPVSGDFGGPKAIRAIGAWLAAHSAVVRAFYVSNVEQYLFQDRKQNAFYDNVATLPIDAKSVFIRPYSIRGGRGFSFAPTGPPLCGMAGFLDAVHAGRVYTNNDALACAR